MHDFADGRKNMNDIFNNYVCSVSHMRSGLPFSKCLARALPIMKHETLFEQNFFFCDADIELTHCGLVMPYHHDDDIHLNQEWLRQWLIA